MANPLYHTLVADTVYSFTLDADYPEVEVLNVDGAAAAYFTVDGSTPGVAQDGSHCLPAAIGFVQRRVRAAGVTVVKVKSAGTPLICVTGLRS